MEAANDESASASASASASGSSLSYEEKYELLQASSKLSVAPMMGYTNPQFRCLVRLLSKHVLLYTEMLAVNVINQQRRLMEEKYRIDNPKATDEEVSQNFCDYYLRRYLQKPSKEILEFHSQFMTNYDEISSSSSLTSSSSPSSLSPPSSLKTGSSNINSSSGKSTKSIHKPIDPCVLQVGGSDPEEMKRAAQTIMDLTDRGMCEFIAINLNCGCPSSKVAGNECYGAALMEDPHLVASLCKSLHDGCRGRMPITVKCRIGIWKGVFPRGAYNPNFDADEYEKLRNFIQIVSTVTSQVTPAMNNDTNSHGDDGDDMQQRISSKRRIVNDFIIHARIAVLSNKSFSTHDNRCIPPLKYEYVRRLVHDFPHLNFTLNGGIQSMKQVQEEFQLCPKLKGVMVGRAIVADPWSFAIADEILYHQNDEDDNDDEKLMNHVDRSRSSSDTEQNEYDNVRKKQNKKYGYEYNNGSSVENIANSTCQIRKQSNGQQNGQKKENETEQRQQQKQRYSQNHRQMILQQYGLYANQQEQEKYDMGENPTDMRRLLIKAITRLFVGEAKSNRYRSTLESICKEHRKNYILRNSNNDDNQYNNKNFHRAENKKNSGNTNDDSNIVHGKNVNATSTQGITANKKNNTRMEKKTSHLHFVVVDSDDDDVDDDDNHHKGQELVGEKEKNQDNNITRSNNNDQSSENDENGILISDILLQTAKDFFPSAIMLETPQETIQRRNNVLVQK